MPKDIEPVTFMQNFKLVQTDNFYAMVMQQANLLALNPGNTEIFPYYLLITLHSY